MTISVTALAWLVGSAVAVTALAPVVLLLFWLSDLVRGRIW